MGDGGVERGGKGWQQAGSRAGGEREQGVAYGLQVGRRRRLQPIQVRSLSPTA